MRGGAVDGCEGLADPRGELGFGLAFAQKRLPDGRLNVLHGEYAAAVIGGEYARRRARRRGGGSLEPQTLVSISLDRRLPALSDAQAPERALYADVADLPDFRGNATAQLFAGAGGQTGVAQQPQHALRGERRSIVQRFAGEEAKRR